MSIHPLRDPEMTITESSTSDSDVIAVDHNAEAGDLDGLFEDTDSGFDEQRSGTDTLKSSVASYVYENGRTYHSFQSGKYAFPNDEEEKHRLDLYHHIFTLFLGGELFASPIKDPRKVLDIGTGTGIWAIEVGYLYPNAQVIGNDLSPIQPTWVPPNVCFEVDDAELEWLQPPGTFDLVHMRFLAASISDWQTLLNRAFDTLCPGGYVEFSDYGGELFCDDDSMPQDSSLKQWFLMVKEASEKAGRPLVVGSHIKEFMEKAGYVDIVERKYKWPIGTWPKSKKYKEIGRWTLPGALDSLSGFSMGLLTRVLGWKKEEVDILVAKSRSELQSMKMHCYAMGYNVYGRKPDPEKNEDDIQ